MLTSKRIKQLFYIHRELGVAMFMAISACGQLVLGLFWPEPCQYIAFAFAAAQAFIAAFLVRNVVRFEQRYPSN